MTRLIFPFVVILVLPCTSLAQDPSERPFPPIQTTPSLAQTGSLRGTVTSPDGSLIPGAQVTVRNTGTGLERTVSTDDSGSFSVVGLPPGTYDVIVGVTGFSQTIVRVQLELSQTSTLNIQLGGNDVPISSPAGGGGGGTRKPPTEDNAEKPSQSETTKKSPANPTATASDVSQQTFENDLDLQKWLDARIKDKKRLVTIVTVSDQTSIFVLQKTSTSSKFDYLVFLVNQPADPAGLSARIGQYPNKTFIGIHRLSPNSYLMVFYGKR